MPSPSCPANVRETKFAVGFIPQVDLVTINPTVDMWVPLKTNTALLDVAHNTETDALDIGKGDEFPITVYKTSSTAGVPIEKYCTSEFMAWLFCFGLGSAAKAAAGTGFTYSATPQDPTVQCINQPVFSYGEQIRPEPNSVIDRASLGMVINDFTINLESGPGRANARVTANLLGTGNVLSPSGITMPNATAEHLLNAAGAATLTINGIDYLLGGNFNSLEFRWNNNTRTDSGYYPGSGLQNGWAIRGRMEFGTREIMLSFVARAQKGSAEYNNLVTQTEAPTTVYIKGASIDASNFHDMKLFFPRTMMSATTSGDADGIVTVNCTVAILKPTDGVTPLCTLSATTLMAGIFGL